jgi:hypothetical protein
LHLFGLVITDYLLFNENVSHFGLSACRDIIRGNAQIRQSVWMRLPSSPFLFVQRRLSIIKT